MRNLKKNIHAENTQKIRKENRIVQSEITTQNFDVNGMESCKYIALASFA
jgi:hypothetical protein